MLVFDNENARKDLQKFQLTKQVESTPNQKIVWKSISNKGTSKSDFDLILRSSLADLIELSAISSN